MGFEAKNTLGPAAASAIRGVRARGPGAQDASARVAIAQGEEHGAHAW
jgi:hypothetical protein